MVGLWEQNSPTVEVVDRQTRFRCNRTVEWLLWGLPLSYICKGIRASVSHWAKGQKVSSRQNSRRVKCVQLRPHDEVSDSILSQELLWLCDKDSSVTVEGERLPWEAST